jgi:hypothetical protein
MSLKTLDRTQWSFADAQRHVEAVVVARLTYEASLLPPEPPRQLMPWERPRDLVAEGRAEAHDQLLVALRDGDLLAQGRYTEERPHGWGYGGNSSGFGLHSGYHTSIRPEQWREGNYRLERLTARDWEFIDIRMPQFIVKAIWPEYVPPARSDIAAAAEASDGVPYSTPYLVLMQEAIAYFGITDVNQGKKECLVDWFLGQQVEGEPVSNKLADAMATLIRLPSAQRGGAKRVLGPDLRQVG